MRIELVPRVTQAAALVQALVLALVISLARASARRGKARVAVAQVGTRKELRM